MAADQLDSFGVDKPDNPSYTREHAIFPTAHNSS